MWLLSTRTAELEFFEEAAVDGGVCYAVLSHIWGENEPSWEDVSRRWMAGGAGRDQAAFANIDACAQLAWDCEIPYLWIDTCCIDVRSSHDVSTAVTQVRAMFAGAVACFVHLPDVGGSMSGALDAKVARDVMRSRWFRCSWTLPELVFSAGSPVWLFSWDWQWLGSSAVFAGAIARHYGIPEDLVCGRYGHEQYHAAERVGWARCRFAHHAEDEAYCLMGLFLAQPMPRRYGEGLLRAFRGLQEQFLVQNGGRDLSLLAW
ncbi:hypothetical protein B0T26DRAFT_625765, partial [Lasiosphaeria miniovina]